MPATPTPSTHAEVQKLTVMSSAVELTVCLEERPADLHDALVNGNNGRVLVLISLVAERAERMVELTGSMCP